MEKMAKCWIRVGILEKVNFAPFLGGFGGGEASMMVMDHPCISYFSRSFQRLESMRI